MIKDNKPFSISENFNKNGTTGLFENSGIMIDGLVTTIKSQPNYEGRFTLLKDLIQLINYTKSGVNQNTKQQKLL